MKCVWRWGEGQRKRLFLVAYSMVGLYGMNEKVGNVSFHDPRDGYNFSKPYSEATAQTIDEEVREFVARAYRRTKKLLTSKKKELELVAKELLKKEVLFKQDLEGLVGGRPRVKEVEG